MPSGVTKAKAVSRGHCCAAYNCSERQKKRSVLNNFDRDADLSFHRFPLNKPDLLALWVRALRRNGFKPTKSSLICSKHFREDDFHQGEKRRKLKSNAVPTIFDFPAHLQKAPTPSRRPIIKHPLTVRKRHSKLFKIKIDVANIFKDHTYCLSNETVNLKGTHKNDKINCLKRSLKNVKAKLRRSILKNKKLNTGIENMKNKKLTDTVS